MKQFKILYTSDASCVILQTLGGPGVYLNPMERSCGSPGQFIMSFILREDTVTPGPIPSQAYREGSVGECGGWESGYISSYKREKQKPKSWEKIKAAPALGVCSLLCLCLH